MDPIQQLTRRAPLPAGRRHLTTQRERLALAIGPDDAHAVLTYATDPILFGDGNVFSANYGVITADIARELADDALAAIIESV
jgi:hypothetical protein